MDPIVEGIGHVQAALEPRHAARSLELPVLSAVAADLSDERSVRLKLLDAVVVVTVLADEQVLFVVLNDRDRIDELSRLGPQRPEHAGDVPLVIEEDYAVIVRVGDGDSTVLQHANSFGLADRVIRHPPLPQEITVLVEHQHPPGVVEYQVLPLR